MIRIFLIVLSFYFIQSQNSEKIVVDKDVFSLDANGANYLDSIKNEADFIYSLKEKEIEKNAFLEGLRSLFSFSPLIKTFLTWLLVFIFVLAIIYYFAKQDMAWIFKSKDQLSMEKHVLNSDKKTSNTFEKLIREAMAKEDYKRVIHYYYTHILSLLASKQIISFSKEKTNLDYFYEIKKTEIKEFFKRFSREFDYIYYGDFDVDRTHIDEISAEYKRFIKSMKI